MCDLCCLWIQHLSLQKDVNGVKEVPPAGSWGAECGQSRSDFPALTNLPSFFSCRCSEQAGSLSQIHSGHLNCCLKEVKFQLFVTQFNPVELLSSSWVAFYLWNNQLSLIHLSWNFTTTMKKIKLTDWIHYKHALWGALAGWGGIGSNMLWLCATQIG